MSRELLCFSVNLILSHGSLSPLDSHSILYHWLSVQLILFINKVALYVRD